MMKKLLFLSLILLISFPAWSWDKLKFDIITDDGPNSLKKATSLGYEGQELRKSMSEMTLIQASYFTIGTNQGLASTTLDDHCGITFGHPYALTSYPIFSIDGSWGKPESFFNLYDSRPKFQGDSLLLSYSIDGMVQFNFSLKPDVTGKQITITTSLKNSDTRSHVFGIGLVFDSALGKKGDGWAVLGDQIVLRDTLLFGSAIPSQLLINERNGLVAGMKVALQFPTLPGKLILANWKDIYENHSPTFSPSELRKIYDLTIKIIWNEQSIPVGGVLSRSIILDLQQPDFNTPLFMRWDLPGFLSLENNLLFPRTFNSYLEISNLTFVTAPNARIIFQFPKDLFSNTTSYQCAVPARETIYQQVKMQSNEIYEDKIVDLVVTLENNNRIEDSMLRHVFIPAVPLSDTGLVCTIDTVIISGYPEIKFTLRAEVEATGQRLFNLSAENIFLYENNTRVRQFTMGKDTTGGVTMLDIVFVLDVTGSMSEEINGVKQNIIEFCDSLKARQIDFQLGMVTFLDVIEKVYNFTRDPQLFKSYVAAQYAHGGGDTPENSLDALYRATEFPFRNSSKRVFIWITDANYHEMDRVTPRNRKEVIDQLLLKDVTVYCIGASTYQTEYYNPIIEPTGGSFYDINGNFRDILLDISRIQSISRYLIAYRSPGAFSGANQIQVKVHFAGLGGTAIAYYQHGGNGNQMAKALSCYPNPFNPTVQITVSLPQNGEGTIDIFNILGQRVKQYQLKDNSLGSKAVLWDARDEFDHLVGVGTYLVRLAIYDSAGKLLGHEYSKILYLK